MTDKVVLFPGVSAPHVGETESPLKESILEALAELTVQAEAGHLTSFAFAGYYNGVGPVLGPHVIAKDLAQVVLALEVIRTMLVDSVFDSEGG